MAGKQEKYTAFGLVIESELALPQLLPGVGEANVYIRFGKVPASIDTSGVHTPWWQAAIGQYLLKVDGIARYYVADGSVITIEPHPAAQIEDIRVFLLSSVFAVLLQQREYLVLHGAAVVIAGKGVVLAGNSGVGKTAISLALYDRGCRFITDEICALSRRNDKTFIYPCMPELHVWRDTLRKENREANDYQPIRQGFGKYVVPAVDRFSSEAIELSHIILLGNHNRETIEWQQVKGGDKFGCLLQNSYQLNVAETVADKEQRFQLCIVIGNNASIWRLTFNKRLYQVGKIVDLLLKEVK